MTLSRAKRDKRHSPLRDRAATLARVVSGVRCPGGSAVAAACGGCRATTLLDAGNAKDAGQKTAQQQQKLKKAA